MKCACFVKLNHKLYLRLEKKEWKKNKVNNELMGISGDGVLHPPKGLRRDVKRVTRWADNTVDDL